MQPWLAHPESNQQFRLRLFCFHYAGGSAAAFRNWPQQMPSQIEVCPVQLPGRGNRIREAPYRQLNPLVADLAPALLPYLNKPFAFFGHSMGAIVAFELARQLRREYRLLPARLFVSACRAPQIPRQPSYGYSDAKFIERLRSLAGTPEEILEHAELTELILPMVRADFEVTETYQYQHQPPLACPITAFGGLQDIHVNRGHLEDWSVHTDKAFAVQMLPGNHFFLRSSQSLLLNLLSQELSQFTQFTM